MTACEGDRAAVRVALDAGDEPTPAPSQLRTGQDGLPAGRVVSGEVMDKKEGFRESRMKGAEPL